MEISREALVKELVELSQPLAAVTDGLAAFPWDCYAPLITLTPRHVEVVLTRFLSGELSARAVQEWADAVECRDDIEVGAGAIDAIHALATPEICGKLTKEVARQLAATLGGGTT